MKSHLNKILFALVTGVAISCADNTLEQEPLDTNFPFQLVLDADEGADLPDAGDYGIEVKFADYLPDLRLPNTSITLSYTITDVEGNMAGVAIDKIVYEVEEGDCVYERELDFTPAADGLSGTITIAPDASLGSVPAEFEVVIALPGEEDTEGSFTVEFSNLQSSENLLLGYPNVFEYSVLDNDLAGEWEYEISSEEEFARFKGLFGPLNPELESLSFADITGKVVAEFEFEEMKFILELAETEEVTTCEDGESETEVVYKEIEFEAEYDAEDNELELEGSHELISDEGLIEAELDYKTEATYEIDGENLLLTFYKIIDEDNYQPGEELFYVEEGISFTFVRD